MKASCKLDAYKLATPLTAVAWTIHSFLLLILRPVVQLPACLKQRRSLPLHNNFKLSYQAITAVSLALLLRRTPCCKLNVLLTHFSHIFSIPHYYSLLATFIHCCMTQDLTATPTCPSGISTAIARVLMLLLCDTLFCTSVSNRHRLNLLSHFSRYISALRSPSFE